MSRPTFQLIGLITRHSNYDCERLPLPLKACVACGSAIKPIKKFTWISKDHAFLHAVACANASQCQDCPICKPALLKIDSPGDRSGLIWVGGPASSAIERWRHGNPAVMLPIASPPRGLVIGSTRVLIAHPYAIAPQGSLFSDDAPMNRETAYAGIIGHFVVTQIRFEAESLDGPETDKLRKRGITVVQAAGETSDAETEEPPI